MHVRLVGIALSPTGAQILKQLLSGAQSKESAEAVVQHALDLKATYAVVEEPYIDKDYSSDYLNFYAGAFRAYPRHTKRIHLFEREVASALDKPLHEQEAELAQAGYIGFVVLRPIAQGPIGKTVLPFPALGDGLIVRRAARANFKAHLLGAGLELKGAAPFIQQDERLGACAQASIWMADRPVHERHRRTPWHSIAEITRLATTPTDAELSRSLPAGSSGLNPIHIIRALRGMGHQPLVDFFVGESEEAEAPAQIAIADKVGAKAPQSGKGAKKKKEPVKTNGLAASSILRYLDSGVPVIVAMTDIGADAGHAITAVGFVESRTATHEISDSYETFVRALIVHDDQRGPYRLMPLRQSDIAVLPKERLLTEGDKILTVEDVVTHMFVPLPMRVFLRADRADTVCDDFLKNFVDIAGPGMLERLKEEAPDVSAVEGFFELVRSGKLIRRTYLTSAGRYRHHLAKSDLDEEVKSELITRTLPHFIWVTELISADAPAVEGEDARQVLGHMVVNATSSTDPNSDLLLVHMPRMVIHRDLDSIEEADQVATSDHKDGETDETPAAGSGAEAQMSLDPMLIPTRPFTETFITYETSAPYQGRRRH